MQTAIFDHYDETAKANIDEKEESEVETVR
jgi:hypothetical protein